MELRRCSRLKLGQELHSLVATSLAHASISTNQRLTVTDTFKLKANQVRPKRELVDIHG